MTARPTAEAPARAALTAADVFKGVVEPQNFRLHVLALFFYKYLSDIQLEAASDPSHEPDAVSGNIPALLAQLTLPTGASFWDLRERLHEPGNARRLDDALETFAVKNPIELEGVFTECKFADLTNDAPFNDHAVGYLLYAFSKPALDLRPSRLGDTHVASDAFEGMLHWFAGTSRADDAIHTHEGLAELLARILEPKSGEDIYDPVCGSGSTLIQVGKCLQDSSSAQDYTLWGQATNRSAWAIAKLNLLMHGEASCNLASGDVIKSPQFTTDVKMLRQFDVLVCNPPFSMETWPYKAAIHDQFDRFRRGMPPKTRGNFAVILHMVASMKPTGGRLAVVVPLGVLFRIGSEAEIRRKLIEENLVDAVISLPEKLLYTAPIPVAILILRSDKQDKDVLFIDASEGFSHGRAQNALASENISSTFLAYKNRIALEGKSALVTPEALADNQYNLSVALYVKKTWQSDEKSAAALILEREDLRKRLDDLNNQISESLSWLKIARQE